MAADWEEIRRLAADFQRAQFADTVQRLSERNCIEIITKLVEDKKLDVVHTLDGKEFITPAQISREIRDELYVHGGRVNIVDLQQIINVDWVHVENRASDIAKSDRGAQLVLGQLIDDSYLDHLAEEVNDKLQEAGLIIIAELCKSYDLPGDFLTEELSKRLGKLIQGEMDQYIRGVIFTPAFVARHKARIRGLFSAITRPTPVSTMIGAFGFQEHLLYSVLEELVNSGRLKGSVVGGRQDKAVYVPDIYARTQNSWVDSFLQQNGYLEFDALLRLGIPDPSSYIRKRFKSSKLLFLRAACVGQALVDQVEASVEEAVSSASWTDLQPILPSCLSMEDTGMFISQAMRNTNTQSSARVLGGTVVVSEKFISSCLLLFDEALQQKAQTEVKNNPVFLITEEDLKQASILTESSAPSKKEKREAERRKKAAEGSGSMKAGGGGSNAREIRIRKTKKKARREEDSDEDTGPSQHSNTHPYER
uniref:E3 UFM1-protein ligase 1 n=1 Tax=Iconisemion striatum TaxID=60296 RepID=A0A1A7WSE6_9TELE